MCGPRAWRAMEEEAKGMTSDELRMTNDKGDLKDRTKRFAVDIMVFCSRLPSTPRIVLNSTFAIRNSTLKKRY